MEEMRTTGPPGRHTDVIAAPPEKKKDEAPEELRPAKIRYGKTAQ
jgi:hypothetical protein